MKVTIKTNNNVLVVFNNAHGTQTFVDNQNDFVVSILSNDAPISKEKFTPLTYINNFDMLEQKQWDFPNIKTIEITK